MRHCVCSFSFRPFPAACGVGVNKFCGFKKKRVEHETTCLELSYDPLKVNMMTDG